VLSVTVAVEQRRCESCARLLASTSRPDRRFCSPACRQRAYDERRRAADHRGNRPAPALLAELEAAVERATDEVRLVAIVAAAAPTNWRAAAWLLSRRWPERWGARRPVEAEPAPPASEPDEFGELDEIATRRRRQREYGPKPKRR
jgi:hypothetical protein